MKYIAAALLLATSLAAAAPVPTDNDWFSITDEPTLQISAKRGSFTLTKTRSGEPVATMQLREFYPVAGRIELNQTYVLLSDCRRGQGKIQTLDMDGNVKYGNDWAKGAGSIASGIAELLCYMYTDRQAKGLS